MNQYHTFSTQPLASGVQLLATDANKPTVSLDSPASLVMRGFHQGQLQVIDKDTSLADAQTILEQTHMRNSFVVDKDNTLLGIISKARLSSSYILRIAAKLGVEREQLTVEHVMINLREIDTVSEVMLRKAVVGDVIKTMEKAGYEYLLVTGNCPSTLCGYFDLIDISQSTGYALNQAKSAKTFSQLFESLVHHAEI